MYPAYTVVLYVVYEYLNRKCLQPACCAPISPSTMSTSPYEALSKLAESTGEAD